MAEPILDPDYWRRRLETAAQPHHAIFKCPLDRWQRIEEKHREILAQHVREDTAILDVGCGWGRLLTLLPKDWSGRYLGIDVSPDFLTKARQDYPDKKFGEVRAEELYLVVERNRFDLAVMISFRPMVRRNLGEEVWAMMEREIRKVANRLLFLEYDENDEGSLE